MGTPVRQAPEGRSRGLWPQPACPCSGDPSRAEQSHGGPSDEGGPCSRETRTLCACFSRACRAVCHTPSPESRMHLRAEGRQGTVARTESKCHVASPGSEGSPRGGPPDIPPGVGAWAGVVDHPGALHPLGALVRAAAGPTAPLTGPPSRPSAWLEGAPQDTGPSRPPGGPPRLGAMPSPAPPGRPPVYLGPF